MGNATMTVKRLIEELLKFPGDSVVLTTGGLGGNDWYEVEVLAEDEADIVGGDYYPLYGKEAPLRPGVQRIPVVLV